MPSLTQWRAMVKRATWESYSDGGYFDTWQHRLRAKVEHAAVVGALEEAQAERDDFRSRLALEQASFRDCDRLLVATTRQLAEAQGKLKRVETELGLWVAAYSPDLVVYPSKEEIQAVNRTPEFTVGRNAMMQVIHEGIARILKEAK